MAELQTPRTPVKFPQEMNSPTFAELASPTLPHDDPRNMSLHESEMMEHHTIKNPELTDLDRLQIRKFSLNMASVIAGFLSAILVVGCLVISYVSFDKKTYQFDSIQESWRRNIISDLVLKVNKTCPTGYTDAITYPWPGANEGCDCTVSRTNEFSKIIHPKRCETAMVASGCIPSPNVEAHVIENWRNYSMLCHTRATGVNMGNLVNKSRFVDGQAVCEEGYMKCPPDNPSMPSMTTGLNATDGSSMCIPKSLGRCPITDLKISSCKVNPDARCFVDNSTDKLVLNSTQDKCLWKSHTCGKGPITMVAIGEYGRCRFEKNLQIAPGHVDHPLMKVQRKPCPPSENTVLLDTASQKEILESANIPYKAIRGYQEDIENYTYSLFIVHYTKWLWQFRESESIDMVFNNRLIIERMSDLHKTSIMYYSFAVFIFVFISPTLIHFELENPDIYKTNKGLYPAVIIIKWFFRCSAIPVIIGLLRANSHIWKNFKLYSDTQFSNTFENTQVQSISQSLQSGIYTFDLIALYVCYGWIVCELIISYLMYSTKQKIALLQKGEQLDGDISCTGEGPSQEPTDSKQTRIDDLEKEIGLDRNTARILVEESAEKHRSATAGKRNDQPDEDLEVELQGGRPSLDVVVEEDHSQPESVPKDKPTKPQPPQEPKDSGEEMTL